MKKSYSIINQRLDEIRRFYFVRLIVFVLLFLLVTGTMITFYILPVYYHVFYIDFVEKYLQVIYPKGNHQTIINILVITIDLLVCFLILIVLYYKYNKEYQKQYLEILFNELALNEFKIIDTYDLDIRLNRIISSYLPYKKSSKELACSLEKEKRFSIFQLNLFEEKLKYGGLILFEGLKQTSSFLQVNTLSKCPLDEYKNKGIFDFNYSNPKFTSNINVYSSFGKETSKIVDDEFLKKIDELQRFCDNKIILTYCENFLTLVVPGWKLKLSEPLIKNIRTNIMEQKIETILILYDYLEFINKKINMEGA